MADQEQGELFPSASARDLAFRDAEALSRKDESVANVFRQLNLQRPDVYSGLNDLASRREAETARMAEELRARGYRVDKSGTRADFTDSNGNIALSADVANTGGIGVEASNSTAAVGGDLAQTPDDVDLSPARVGITDGDQVIGDASEADPNEVVTAERTRDGMALDQSRRELEDSVGGVVDVARSSVENPTGSRDDDSTMTAAERRRQRRERRQRQQEEGTDEA